MNIYVFKTDLKSDHNIQILKPILNRHDNIISWSIDTDDIDNVLRVEASENMSEKDIISLVNMQGLFCEALPD